MPSSSFILHPLSFRRHRRAFSLIELLVVIGILVGLLAILVPTISSARKRAIRTRQQQDFQAIEMGLNAYKSDFGDYPRPSATGISGFATLGYALFAPGPAVHSATSLHPPDPLQAGKHYEGGEVVAALSPTGTFVAIAHNDTGIAPPNADYWSASPWQDGFEGPGFRLRAQGQKYGPYLQAEKFKIRGYAVLDLWGHPILYFPARTGAINVNKPATPGTLPPTFVWDSRDIASFTPSPKPLFDVADNLAMLGGKFTLPATDPSNVAARQTLQKMLGDTDLDGWVGQGESAHTTNPILLWSAGPDAEGDDLFKYGFNAQGKSDDVLNFDLPVGLAKK